MNPGEEKRFDGLLRNKFNEFEAAPNAAVWQAVSQTLPPAKTGLMQRALPFGLGTAFGIMVSLGFVTGYQQWSGNSLSGASATQTALTPANQPETALAPATAALSANQPSAVAGLNAPAPKPAGNQNALALNTEENSTGTNRNYNTATYSHQRYQTSEFQHNRYAASETVRNVNAGQPAENGQAVANRPVTASEKQQSATTIPATPAAPANTIAQLPVKAADHSAWLMGHELDTAIANVLTDNPKLADNKAELKELLKAQGTVLALLQNRNDSLLLAMKDADLDSTLAKVRINRPRRHSSNIKPPVGWPSPSDWAITASYEANPQWGGLAMSHTNAKATENVRLSRTVTAGIKRRINQQLSVSAGLGLVQVESEMNYNRKQEFTENGPNGTIITHVIDQHQFLRPEYTFVTLPLAMHYRLGGYGHLGIGFSAGVQTNLYRGGTMAVFQDGQYALQKASSSQGPFRSLSMAASGGIDFSYRVAPRLTLQGGPTLRYWAISPYKQADAGFKFLPGLQFGASWDL